MRQLKGLKTSFLYRFLIYFVFMIVVPILCSWWIYERVLNLYYRENILATEQINMENSLSLLDASLNAAANVFVALEGNPDVTYYLDESSGKSKMMYGTFRRVHAFCEELYAMTPYLSSLKIYCDSTRVLYAKPFVRIENDVPDEEVRIALEHAGLHEIIWKVVGSDVEEFPAIYGYRKIYTENYLRCIGYMEVQLSPQLFADYFDLLSGLLVDSESALMLYQGDALIYSTANWAERSAFPEDTESGYGIRLFQNRYRNCVMIPRLDLSLIRLGRLWNWNNLPSGNGPSIFISVILLLLLASFSLFFANIVMLSRRILAFSSFIRLSDPDNLSAFHPMKKTARRKDELDILIDAYNTLIRENNSLISRVEKMELFAQEARFRALQNQIHPHFIYGTLETIRMTALLNGDRAAASMIFDLSSLIRFSISISSKAVTLKDELEIAEHYLKIQKIRFDDRIDYDFRIDDELLGLEVPSFILQPILENAIVYGVSRTMENCMLIVEARQETACTVLSVANTGLLITRQRLEEMNNLLSGKGVPETSQGNRNGLALNNIKERVAIFFDGKASVRLDLRDGYTMTVIMIEE